MSIMASIDAIWRAMGGHSSGPAALLFLIKVTVLLVAAVMVALLMRRTSAGARHLVWLVVLTALLVFPGLALWGPVQLNILPSALATASIGAALPATNPKAQEERKVLPADSPAPAGGEVVANQAASGNAGTTRPFITTANLLLMIWAGVMLLLFGWLLHGWWAVNRIVNRAQPLDDPTWQGPLYEIADRLELDHAPQLLRSTDVHMPFASGLFQAIIVLPAESDAWPAEQRMAVLIHELGHVRRRDLIGHTLGRIACAIYWFHPLVWTAARHLRDESERACDDLALRFGARPSAYAEHLLAIVTSVRDHATPSVALAMAHRKEFEGRMLAILDPHLRRIAPGRVQTAATVVSLVLLAVVIGAAAPVQPVVHAPVVRNGTGITATPPAVPHADHRADSLTSAITTNRKRESKQRNVAINTNVATTINLLGAAGTPDTSSERISMLARLLRSDSSASVRRVAAWGLEQNVESPAAKDALKHAVTSDNDAAVRKMAVWAIGSGGEDADASMMITVAQNDASPEVRETAAWALGGHGVAAGAVTLGNLVAHDPSAFVRATAAWALGNLDLKKAPTGLIDALADADADVRYKASWALSEIGDKAALPALRKAMDHETHDGAIRAQLRAVVASGIDPSELATMLKSSNAEVRAAAVRALAGAGTNSPWPWPWPRPIPRP